MRIASSAALPLALLLAAGVVLATPVTTWRPRADEGYYLRYATRIAEHGPGAFPDLFREYLEDPVSRQLFPSPIRVTAILLGALAVRLGGPDFASLAHLSLAAFLVLLVLVFAGVRRLVGPRAAAATTLLLAASPLHLAMARRALSDSLNATLLVGCLGLCIAAITAERASRRRWWAVAAGYTVAFLGRELNLVLVPLSLALLAGFTLRHRRRLPIAAACWVSAVPLGAAALVAACAAGGFAPAWQAFAGTVLQPGQNAYALQYGGGPWFRYLLDYLLLSPWTLLLYVAWLGQLAGGGHTRERVWAWTLVPVLFLAAAAPFPKFVRWALVLDAPLRLGAVLGLQRMMRDRPADRGATLRLGLALAVLIAADLDGFYRLFVVGDIYDPTTALLAAWRGLVPR